VVNCFCRGLNANTTIKRVILSGNDLGEMGAKALAKALDLTAVRTITAHFTK